MRYPNSPCWRSSEISSQSEPWSTARPFTGQMASVADAGLGRGCGPRSRMRASVADAGLRSSGGLDEHVFESGAAGLQPPQPQPQVGRQVSNQIGQRIVSGNGEDVPVDGCFRAVRY